MPPKKKDDKKAAEDEANQQLEDSGQFVFPDGGRYNGQIQRKEGVLRRNGLGNYTDNFLSYEGGWKDDLMHGEGTVSFSSGASYVGSLFENKFDGKGTYRWSDGTCYDGQWRYNRMHGEGSYTDHEGQVWTGRFYNGTGPGLRLMPKIQALGVALTNQSR